jgi:uncharacterized protein
MELRRWNDILAIKTDEGKFVGYHSRNLEVAEVSEEIWKASATDSSAASAHPEAIRGLNEWNTQPLTSQAEQRSKLVNSFTVNVTQICNLHCTYCAAGGDGSYGDPVKRISVEKTLPQLASFMAKLPAGETFRINFVGGEPLLYPEGIRLIAEYVREKGRELDLRTKFKIVTNGTQFNRHNIELLRQIQPYVVVSLDGPAEINDARRPSKGCLAVTDKVIEGLNLLQPFKSDLEELEISGVFGPGNLDLVAAWDFYSQFNADSFDFIFDHHCQDIEVSKQFVASFRNLAQKVFSELGEAGLRKIRTFDAYFQTLDSQIRVENFCGAGKNFLVIDSRNTLYTCPWESGKLAEAVGFSDSVWAGKLEFYQSPLVEKADCRGCWARYMCGGGCMYVHKNSTGSKNKVDELFCYRIRSLISLTILYYQRSRNFEELDHVEH